jgi:mono/diheme cytochrome c family protein
MMLQSKLFRRLGALLLVVLLLAGGVWFIAFRTVAQEPFADMATEFNHGSIGNEDAQGIPYWIWRVLPTLFNDHLPGPTGYTSLGLYWEQGAELPVGFSKKTVGVERVSINCAFCHQSTYRLRPDEPSKLAVAGTGNRVAVQGYLRFLAQAGNDPRFAANTLMDQITLIYDMPWWERLAYRFLFIPATKKALQQQGRDFAWSDANPDWGRGRIDPFNPVKYGILGMGNDGTIGNSDMMPLWQQKRAEGENAAGEPKSLHWDGLNTSLHEVVVTGAVGDGMSYRNYGRDSVKERIARIEAYVRELEPPPSPFSPGRDPLDPFHVDPEQVAEGETLYTQHCADCHSPDGARFRTAIPVGEIGVDRHRVEMWNAEAARRYNAYSENGHEWGFSGFRDVDGYVAVSHTGLWLRGPYLHNGSVPTLRDMLRPPPERPGIFYRGYDLIDADNGGFMASGPQAERLGERFDTSLPGNANRGHLYGTDLPPEDKEALLAYLKTL